MTALESDMFEITADRESWMDWLARWPVVTCLFITAMFMLATNDPDAVSKWQEVTRAKGIQLSLVLETGRANRQIAFILLGLWGASSLLRAGRRYRYVPALLFPMLVFIGWAFASLIWSTDRSFTAKRLVVFTCLAAAVFGFVRRMRVRDLALLALVGCSIQMFANIAADFAWSTGEYGKSGYRMSGLQHPNHVGINAVFLVIASLYFFDRTRLKRFLFLLAVALVVVFVSKSRSSLFAGMGAVALYAVLRWPLRNVMVAAFALLIGVSAFAVLDQTGIVPDDWSNIIHMGREDSQSTALTGRPLIWSAALEQFDGDFVRYLTGVGFDTFWTPHRAMFVSERLGFHISEGHNSYFDLMLTLGVIGAGCYIAVLLGSVGRWSVLASRHANAGYAFCAAVLVFAIIHGLTESTLVAPNFPTFFSFASMAFLATRSPRPYPRDAEERP